MDYSLFSEKMVITSQNVQIALGKRLFITHYVASDQVYTVYHSSSNTKTQLDMFKYQIVTERSSETQMFRVNTVLLYRSSCLFFDFIFESFPVETSLSVCHVTSLDQDQPVHPQSDHGLHCSLIRFRNEYTYRGGNCQLFFAILLKEQSVQGLQCLPFHFVF